MKRFLTILLILSCFSAVGQYGPRNTIYGVWYTRMKFDSVLHVPSINDTLLHTVDTSSQIRVIRGELWYHSGWWKRAGGGSTGTTSTFRIHAIYPVTAPNDSTVSINRTYFDSLYLLKNDSVLANRITANTIAIATKQNQLNGTGFVKASGTTISYDNSTYLTTSVAASTYIKRIGNAAFPSGATTDSLLTINSSGNVRAIDPFLNQPFVRGDLADIPSSINYVQLRNLSDTVFFGTNNVAFAKYNFANSSNFYGAASFGNVAPVSGYQLTVNGKITTAADIGSADAYLMTSRQITNGATGNVLHIQPNTYTSNSSLTGILIESKQGASGTNNVNNGIIALAAPDAPFFYSNYTGFRSYAQPSFKAADIVNQFVADSISTLNDKVYGFVQKGSNSIDSFAAAAIYTPNIPTYSAGGYKSLVLNDNTKKWEITTISSGSTIDTTSLSNRINLKVDKITGKGLSTEDYTTAEKTKLSGIATGATANSSDATLLARANHTGTQAESTVTGLISDLAGKEDVSNKTATQSSSTTTYPNWQGVTNYVGALSGTYQPLENQRLSTTNTPTFAGLTSNGILNLIGLTGTPAAPASGTQRIYADSTGAFTMQGSNGYAFSISKARLTANHRIYPQNKDYTPADSADVAANTASIATNSANIATNTSNIATNATAITTKLTASNNLSDLANAATARTNLGLTGTGYSKFSGSTITYNATIPNADLTNSAISGISLGSNLANLTPGRGLTGSAYNGSAAQTFGLDTTQAYTFTGKQTVQLTTTQLQLGYDASNNATFTVGSAGTFTINSTGNTVFTPLVVATAGFQTANTGANANLFINSGAGASAITQSQYLPLSATGIHARVGIRGSTGVTPTVNYSYGSFVIGTEVVTIPASGTSALFAQQIIRPLTINTGAGTLTNSAGLYIEDSSANATNNYAMWVDNGTSRFDGAIGVNVTKPAATALLDITSTTKGFLPPRMTKTQRDAITSPATGLMIWQTDNTPGLRVYNGTNWMRFTETAD